MKRLTAFLALMLLGISGMQAAIHNVRDYGATGDGVTIDSPAINAAIQAAARDGGGTIYFPAGTYASYSIRLASHICLKLEAGAVLLAAKPTKDDGYDEAEPNEWEAYQDFGHSHWKNSLIWGIGLEDISIIGPGKIDGSGLSNGFGLGKRTKIDGDFELPDHQGNKAISLKECRGVRLKDLTCYRCGHFALLATGVDNMDISGLIIDSNRDGLDIDCCRNVSVRGCIVNTPWDDGIVLKSTYALGRYIDTENVVISDCMLSGYGVGCMLDGTRSMPGKEGPWDPEKLWRRAAGRIKLGTESSGGYRNIAITNCSFDLSGGVMLESMDGGDLEDVVISNLTMRRAVGAPLFLRIGARMRSPQGRQIGHMRRILISDINAYDSETTYNTIIAGIPGHCIEDVTLRNLHLHGMGVMNATGQLKEVPEYEKNYPDPWMFGRDKKMPSKGMFLRHVRGLTLDGVHFRFAQPDDRPLIIKEDVQGLVARDITEEGKSVKVK